jgi:hypothetical protein
MTTVRQPRKKVKKYCTKLQQPGTRLVPLLIKRKRQVDCFFYAPACAQCGKAILDFENANVSVCNLASSKPVKLTSFDGATFYVLESDGAWVFCKSCDRSENKPWTGANYIFRDDQRRSFEKGEL